MKKHIRKIAEYIDLYRDDTTGIAWIEDGTVGIGVSVHPNIDESGSVAGMKARGFWGMKDRIVRSHGWAYNIDKFVCDKSNRLELIVADECRCQACIERRMEERWP